MCQITSAASTRIQIVVILFSCLSPAHRWEAEILWYGSGLRPDPLRRTIGDSGFLQAAQAVPPIMEI